MPTFQACPGIAHVTVSAAGQDGDTYQNTFHISNGAGTAWTSADLTTLCNGFNSFFTTGWGGGSIAPSLPVGTNITEISARDLTVANGNEVTITVAINGTDAALPLQAGLSKAFTLRTGLAGRSYRGRLFQFGLRVDHVSGTDQNAMSAAALASFTANWGQLIAAVTALHAGWVWVVLSRSNNLTRRATGVGTPVVSVGYSHIYFDFQRRRAPAHARHH